MMVIRGTRNQSPFAIKFTQLCQFRTLLEQSLITFISDLRQLACFLNNYDKLKKKKAEQIRAWHTVILVGLQQAFEFQPDSGPNLATGLSFVHSC